MKHFVLMRFILQQKGILDKVLYRRIIKRRFEMDVKTIAPPFAKVVDGPDKGLSIPLHDGTIALGRASENDITLADPILSRHHCKLEIAGNAIKVIDLDSANGTFLNDTEVRESLVRDGDRIQIGDTFIQFFLTQQPTLVDIKATPAQESKTPDQANSGIVVDLGFNQQNEVEETSKGANWRPLVWGLAAVAILAVAASVILRSPSTDNGPVIVKPVEPTLLPLEIYYEKVEATTNSIFRYCMTLLPSGNLAVEIDDLAEDRHIRKDAQISTNSIMRLAKLIEKSGFFRMDDIPIGIAPEGQLATWDITVIANKNSRRLFVENRIEPQIFRDVREALETFGKNELGIWAIQYPKEKLIEMAQESYTHARNLFAERSIAHGNIFRAVKSYKESAFYLETIEPKPEFYGAAVSELAEAEEELQKRYEEQRFKADRAINLRDWQTAATELRILREQIPDDNDPRNADATRKLLDVENRLKKERN